MFRILEKLKQYLRVVSGVQTVEIASLFDKAVTISTDPIYGPDGKIKFVRKGTLEDIHIHTPRGYKKVLHVLETIPYQVYCLKTASGRTLEGADTHIVMTQEGQTFIKDLKIGQGVLSETGIDTVVSITKLGELVPMYDLELEE
jgi:hypothetical protein